MRPRLISAATVAVVLAGSLSATAAPPDAPVALRAQAAPADEHVRRAPVSPVVARALGPTGELRGMALNDVSAGRALAATVADFPRLAAEGVTSVTVYVYLYLSSPTGTTVSSGPYTPTDAELEVVSAAARDHGMDLHLSPVLLDQETNSWRGGYVPSDVDEFFASYTAQVVRYAELAQRLGVTLFYVGSENQMIARHTAHWRSLVRSVRAVYPGALSYLSTAYTTSAVRWWDAVDLVAISPYFSMGEDDNPTYERFLSAWAEVHTPFVRSLAKRLPRPLIYGEVGYHSQQQAFATPALKPPFTKMPAPAAQGDAYRALLDVLKAEPHVYGVTWWRWTSSGVGPADTTFSPNRKPAECALAARWSPHPDVREAAALPGCDLHELDQALAVVGGLLPVGAR